jgi:phage baseplate assembly protein gpV
MSRVPGVVSAIVSSIDDPASLGRLQVQFDWMPEAPQSYWARVAAPMAGKNYGAFFMPEVGDEVLVAFDHGDVSHPYVVGFCWSAPSSPPFDATQKKRGIQSVSGHELLFDDSAAAAVTLKTSAGNTLVEDDQAGTITLQTPDQVTVQLTSATGGGPQVQITLPTGDLITLGAAGLTILTSSALTVTALSATITAPALTLDAAMTTVTGALTVSGPVIAGGIVSPTYTPGIGNLL